MSQRIPIYEQFQEVCRGKSGALFTTSELISAMAASFGTPSGSVLPADFCYNRRNKGSRPLEMCLFVQFGTGEYKYLGPNAPYSGLAVHSPKGSQIDVVVGEWVNGVFHPQDAPEPANDQTRTEKPPVQSNGTEARTAAPSPSLQALSREQIQHLYEEYYQILDRETRMFGVNPAETRHLIGRIGEFKVALELNGTLAHRVNQEGFDVVAEGRAISVKTTTQKSGFVTVNPATAHLVDTLYVLQYDGGAFLTVYHGPIKAALEIGRDYQGKRELQLGKLRKLQDDLGI